MWMCLPRALAPLLSWHDSARCVCSGKRRIQCPNSSATVSLTERSQSGAFHWKFPSLCKKQSKTKKGSSSLRITDYQDYEPALSEGEHLVLCSPPASGCKLCIHWSQERRWMETDALVSTIYWYSRVGQLEMSDMWRDSCLNCLWSSGHLLDTGSFTFAFLFWCLRYLMSVAEFTTSLRRVNDVGYLPSRWSITVRAKLERDLGWAVLGPSRISRTQSCFVLDLLSWDLKVEMILL